jgi:two-component system sensor histidine kinase KdpD
MSQVFSDNQYREEGRADPEVLLKRYHLRDSDLTTCTSGTENQQQKHQGQLRIYLGATAGVGKTYAMLGDGHQRKTQGIDVVVGYLETHGRAQTQAQVGNLEVIARKKCFYRGITLEEMDTEAIITRHPQLALIDELAHRNVPGSKHPKRYQDVLEILDAGIDVVTTLNVQHLESRNDLVASITGIEVRETLPDRLLDQADEVELIDIDPHMLRQRMQHGDIYPAECIEVALNNFFREGNLTALRELALRVTAEKTETQLQQYMDEHAIHKTWAATEHVLVGFDHHLQSQQVIRDAWQLAHGLDADLIAVHIEPEGYPALIHSVFLLVKYGKKAGKRYIEEQCRLQEHALFAQDLGAKVVQSRSCDIAKALIEIVHERHITQVVLGLSARSGWEELLRGSVPNRLLRLSLDMDIHLVPTHRVNKPEE